MDGCSEWREHAVNISPDTHPAVAATLGSHRPKIEITVQSVSGSIECCRASHALVGVGFSNKCRFETSEISQVAHIFQRALQDRSEERRVGKECRWRWSR